MMEVAISTNRIITHNSRVMVFDTFVIVPIAGRPRLSLLARACTTMGIFGIVIVAVFLQNASAFCFLPTNTHCIAAKATNTQCRISDALRRRLYATSRDVDDTDSDTAPVVDELLELIERKEEKEENPDKNAIPDLISKLSSNAEEYILDDGSSSSLFDPLVGYYNVSYTLTSRPNDNPVGGKWTRGLWTIKRTMQHILPPLPVAPPTKDIDHSSASNESSSVASKAVAQVVNVIRLELLLGFVGVWVLLRGDAVPLKLDPASMESNDTIDEDNSKKKKSPPKLLPSLSDRTVKAYFDRPLIGVSLLRNRKNSKSLLKRVLTLGPTSAVVLDTPYADSRIRLGKGGTSGSQFVFRRLPETDEEARDGWKWLIEDGKNKFGRSLTKRGLVFRLGVLGLGFGLLSRVLQQRWIKLLAGAYGVVSCISIFGLVRSTGGIETEGDTYMEGKQ